MTAGPGPVSGFYGLSSGSDRVRMLCVSAVGILVLGVGILCALAAGPLHAQCAVQWKIGIPCFDVSSLLVNQIKEWSTESCPGTSQRCLYSGRSVSRSWYAILDSGTNYLNMYNLMRGSGLSSSPDFSESTSDRLCTQFSSTRQKLPP
ncbi:uncharacterized protein isoform X4 [Danio rerio]|uniref:Uncharacterized protein isoform X4 n=1 Tax=Danio rerio TaxID=7955 RepID=A0AC58GFG7_DANRE